MAAADESKPASPEDVSAVTGEQAGAPEGAAERASGPAGEGGTGQTVEELQALLAERTDEATRYRDLYLRERAEMENFRRRMQREKADVVRYASESIVRDLLPVLDNLERAIEHATAGGDLQPLVEGVRMVLKGALDVLQRHGVTRIDAAGERFDPTRHEALLRVSDDTVEPNTVVQQLAPGYMLHDRLLRAAQVGVSVKPAVESGGSDD